MDSKQIGEKLGIMLNSHSVYTPKEKGNAAANIVVYLRDLESNAAQLEKNNKLAELHCLYLSQKCDLLTLEIDRIRNLALMAEQTLRNDRYADRVKHALAYLVEAQEEE